jgi:hypothetical protein
MSHKIERICICGNKFLTTNARIKSGRGKFCSKKCQYANASRKKGIKYKIKVENRGWIKKGDHLPQRRWTEEEKKKQSNRLKGKRNSIATEFKKGQNIGESNHRWRNAMPQSLKKKEMVAGRDRPEQCEICGAFGKDFKKGLCFDHDHKTGKFRGWICMRCNLAIGLAKDNSELLIAMSNYIKKCGA